MRVLLVIVLVLVVLLLLVTEVKDLAWSLTTGYFVIVLTINEWKKPR